MVAAAVADIEQHQDLLLLQEHQLLSLLAVAALQAEQVLALGKMDKTLYFQQ